MSVGQLAVVIMGFLLYVSCVFPLQLLTHFPCSVCLVFYL